jgi:hypothetical protein
MNYYHKTVKMNHTAKTGHTANAGHTAKSGHTAITRQNELLSNQPSQFLRLRIFIKSTISVFEAQNYYQINHLSF